LNDLRSFPELARSEAGYQLHLVQNGLAPVDAKAVPSIGAGVVELRIREEAGIFRVMYVARLVDAVVDVNPHLWGKHVAGTGHAIVAPGTLADEPVDLVVAMNPVYASEIRAELDRLSPGAQLLALGA